MLLEKIILVLLILSTVYLSYYYDEKADNFLPSSLNLESDQKKYSFYIFIRNIFYGAILIEGFYMSQLQPIFSLE